VTVLKAADRHPVATLLALGFATYVALLAWSAVGSGSLLLARAGGAERQAIYGQFAASAVAMLAVTLTVLAILLALPDRPGVQELRESSTWPLLQGTLLATATLCLITLVSSHLGAALDIAAKGKAWLGLLAFTAAAMSVIAVVLCGIAFALFLHASQQPIDPSRGRGE
jgi:hypothetical protein